MSRLRNHLEAARSTWSELPERDRARLASLLADPGGAEREKERLAEELLQRLLANDRSLPELYSRAAEGARQQLAETARRVSEVMFEAGDGVAAPFITVYGQHLLALALPLRPAGTNFDFDELRQLLGLAHSHEVLAPLARQRAAAQLSRDLFHEVGEDLRAKAYELLAAPLTSAAPGPWLAKPDRLLLSVDHVTLGCARYLAGLDTPERDQYGFDELRAGPGGRAKRVDQVTVKFDPRQADVAADLSSPASELKAKLFVALFALAAQATARGESGSQRVRLRDLLELMGFELGRVTNSRYYWRYASHLTRHLLIDLPGRVVAMQLSFAGEAAPRVVFERLVSLSRPLDGARLPLAQGAERLLLSSLGGSNEGAVEALRKSGVEGFEFALSGELLEAHGIGRPLNAIEHVPVEVLSLGGAAFWLAWQVAFLRRWARPPTSGGQGKVLLRALEETGHLAAHTRGQRVRYKDALSDWWRDVGELAGMGLLDEPGVRMYGQRGNSWRDISTEMSRSLDPGAERLTRSRLQEVRVVFQIPRWRVAQLEEARGRKRRRSAANA